MKLRDILIDRQCQACRKEHQRHQISYGYGNYMQRGHHVEEKCLVIFPELRKKFLENLEKRMTYFFTGEEEHLLSKREEGRDRELKKEVVRENRHQDQKMVEVQGKYIELKEMKEH